jgi:hypothetical protein
MDEQIEALTAVVALQQKAIEVQTSQIGELSTHVGLLVQCVAQLLGEETGSPVADEDASSQRVDLDGRRY